MSDVEETGFAGMGFDRGADRSYANLKPLEGDGICACGHTRRDHIALLWGQHSHDGACRARGCFCEKFTAAAEFSP